jgi:sugar lactone lactonase YvrE
MYMYAGNMYVVDKSAKTIWRYAGTEAGFGSGQKWNTNPIEANLENAVSLAIDGAIWLGFGSGDLQKYSLGNRISFEISGVNPELTFLNAIYTNEELGYIYILDRQGGRVVVIDKEGKYKAQYIHDKIKEATDIAVSEKNKKIIILTGEKLLSLEAKHL